MKNKKKYYHFFENYGLIIAVSLPILVLLCLLLKNQFTLFTGKEFQLDVYGFDPIDLVAGHYLSYRVDYAVPGVCGKLPRTDLGHESAFVCLEPRFFSYTKPTPAQCAAFIKGECRFGQFYSGMERFYIPEKYAQPLSRVIRDKKAKIVFVTGFNGQGIVKQLLIEGVPWKQYLSQISDR